MTFAQLKSDLADKLHEPTTLTNLYWSTVWRAKAINDGQKEFVRLTKCLEGKTTTFNSVASQMEYDLNSLVTDFLIVSDDGGVAYNNDPLDPRDIEWLDKYNDGWRSAAAGTPEYFYMRQLVYLGIVPKPSSAVTNGIKIYYVPKPTTLSDDADVPFFGLNALEDYHEACSDYAAWKGLELRRRYDEATYFKNKFLEQKDKYLASATEAKPDKRQGMRAKITRSKYI